MKNRNNSSRPISGNPRSRPSSSSENTCVAKNDPQRAYTSQGSARFFGEHYGDSISIDVSKLLPDVLIVDVSTDPIEFWVIEVVATDGPITERRKNALIKWAESQGIPASQLRYHSLLIEATFRCQEKPSDPGRRHFRLVLG